MPSACLEIVMFPKRSDAVLSMLRYISSIDRSSLESTLRGLAWPGRAPGRSPLMLPPRLKIESDMKICNSSGRNIFAGGPWPRPRPRLSQKVKARRK
jgi:hypothetical protein